MIMDILYFLVLWYWILYMSTLPFRHLFLESPKSDTDNVFQKDLQRLLDHQQLPSYLAPFHPISRRR
jgi:hypothetical protein